MTLPTAKQLNQIGIDVTDREIEEFTTIEDLTDYLDESGYFEVVIPYFEDSMKYLAKNDPSLEESLELAEEEGYTPSCLNSEKLASLHASQKLREAYENL